MNYLKKILKDNYNRFAGKADDLYISTDGIGTKVSLAIEKNYIDNLGYDIVNHCINDMICEFALPKYFCAYLGLSEANEPLIKSLIQNIDVATKENGIKYVSGETAIMDTVYKEKQFEIVGTIIGKQWWEQNGNIDTNDVIVSIASNGLHTNGYTAVRCLNGCFYSDNPEMNVRNDLLCPHLNYFDIIDYLFTEGIQIKKMAHITGGGWLNLKRILPNDLDFNLKSLSIRPKIFDILSNYYVKDTLYTNFNMGSGLMIIMPKRYWSRIKNYWQLENIGNVVKGSGKIFIDKEELYDDM